MILMENSIQMALAYFQAPLSFFWRWGDGGAVVEWQDGRTLCYRKELESYLDALQDRGLPPLASVLLVIAACQDNWKQSPINGEGLGELAEKLGEKLNPESQEAISLLGRIHDLPKAFRGPETRGWLLKALFPDNDPAHAAVSFLDTKEVLQTFRQGRIDAWLTHVAIHEMADLLNDALHPLVLAAREFPTTQALDTFVRTGLKNVPKPAEIPVPSTTETETPTLIEELLEDNRTSGIAHLAQHLIAALHIPMQARGSNDMPIGGVSDITNKGNLDRLLLSELAQDDTTLMARLANNEALYLRREEPPMKLEKERIVLIDTTLRLWGMPKAFSVSAALACILTLRPGLSMRGFVLGGSHYLPADLASKDGILDVLGRLDTDLHCGDALADCLKEVGRQGKEVILVTGQENIHSPEFAPLLTALQPQLDILIALGRTGQMEMFELKQGKRKLHSSALFDLGDLLFRQPTRKHRSGQQPQRPGDDLMPAFFGHSVAPMYFPPTSQRMRSQNTRRLSSTRIAVITNSRRVLFWRSSQSGALELLPYLEEASSVYIEECAGKCILIVLFDRAKKILKCHRYDLQTHLLKTIDMGHVTIDHYALFGLEGDQLLFFAKSWPNKTHNVYFRCDTATGDLQQVQTSIEPDIQIESIDSHKFQKADLKSVINPGISTIQKAKRIYLSANGQLVFDGHRLVVKKGYEWELIWEQAAADGRSKSLGYTEAEAFALPLYAGGPPALRRTTWQDGTIAYMDPRGFLHLRSSDPALAQVTIATVIGKPTAAWASTGECTGNPYLYRSEAGSRTSAELFEQRYLLPIFQRIQNYR